MARRGSSVRGASSLRRTLRRLPDAARDEIADAMQAGGQQLLARAKAETPVRSGKLRGALSMKLARKTLVLRIGLLTKAVQRSLFYGYILDAGRKAKTVTIRRGPRAGSRMRIKAIAPSRYNFVFGRRKDFGSSVLPKVRIALEGALTESIRDGGND